METEILVPQIVFFFTSCSKKSASQNCSKLVSQQVTMCRVISVLKNKQMVYVFLNGVSENMVGSFVWDTLMDHFE
jgi:hypothetical protein